MTTGIDRYAARSSHDVLRLIQEHPLVWVVSTTAGTSPLATMLPVLPVAGPEGEVTALVGHFARNNAQLSMLRSEPRAFILASGVNGYISPSWLRDRTRAPTWIYVGAQFTVDIELFDEPGRIGEHLRELVDTMEMGRSDAWRIDEMGARFHSLSKGVVGFRAVVREMRARFKLGQDERDSEFHDITLALDGAGGSPLLDWMKRFNPGRR